jgi:hypothetical protein
MRSLSRSNGERSYRLTSDQIGLYQPEVDNIRAALDWAFLPTGDAPSASS